MYNKLRFDYTQNKNFVSYLFYVTTALQIFFPDIIIALKVCMCPCYLLFYSVRCSCVFYSWALCLLNKKNQWIYIHAV